ncbi:MAG: hypothetical protein Q9164_004363, partial [Protoblastenia rupestris]
MSDYTKFTVAKLKEELDRRGLPKSGLKAALIHRLIEADAESKEEGVDAASTRNGQEQVAENSARPGAGTDKASTALGVEAAENGTAEDEAAVKGEAMTWQPENAEGARQEKINGSIELEISGTATKSPILEEVTTSKLDLQDESIARQAATSPAKSDVLPGSLTQPASYEDTMEIPLPTPAQTQNELSSTMNAFPPMSTQTSVTGEELAEDSKKRKRRSQSPPPSSIDTSKRLKGGNFNNTKPEVKLPEDTILQDAPPTSEPMQLSADTQLNGYSEAGEKDITTNITNKLSAQNDVDAPLATRSRSTTPISSEPSNTQPVQSPSDRRFKPLAAPATKLASPPR